MSIFYSVGKIIGCLFKTTVQSRPSSGDITSKLHWPPPGTFPVAAVGESFYRVAIAQVAKNEPGDQALVFCTATLIPEDDNEHDPLAVAIWISNAKVAHLSRIDAQSLRKCLTSSGLGGVSTTCDAVIHGGGHQNGREYSYSIELDFDLGVNLNSAEQVKLNYPNPLRLANAPALAKLTETSYELNVPFVDREALGHCSLGCKLKLWTRDDLEHIHFFAPKSIGGTGRVAVLSKHLAPEVVKNLSRVLATIEKIDGRSCVIWCKLEAEDAGVKRTRKSK
jgi:hypothetical protein